VRVRIFVHAHVGPFSPGYPERYNNISQCRAHSGTHNTPTIRAQSNLADRQKCNS